ncbi:MAG TPA: amino acid transporter, partial [Candidatus Melainabacteria bacterium]|nr:amino acid transporter [Candidatus Melainabacteria bacterium]
PLYLPRYGMAPDWALAKRPLVIVLTIISLIVTWVFGANVDAQAGAFATGLLVLVSSAPVAVTLVVMKESIAKTVFFILSSLIFVGASLSIMVIRPDGLQIALFFIAMVIGVSLLSRALRSTELRVGEVVFDENTKRFLEEARGSYWGEIRILSHKPDDMDYSAKEAQARRLHSIQSPEGNFIFLEVTTGDVSEFRDEKLELTGVEENGFQIIRCNSLSVPNAIAAILLKIRNDTGSVPHIYFGWTEGHPLLYILKYVLFGEGETAPLTREILRSAEDDAEKRPVVHVA